MKKILLPCAVALTMSFACCTWAKSNQPQADNSNKVETVDLKKCTKVEVKTTLGDIELALYNETPKHRDNFIKLVNEGYYDGVLFHRVINEFMCQAGYGNSRNATADTRLGDGDPGYTIEAEMVYPKLFHKRGALAAARTPDQVNPERRSSGSQFYIVTGKKYTAAQLAQFEQSRRNQQMQEIFNGLASAHRKQIIMWRREGNTQALDSLQNQLVEQTKAQVEKDGAFTFTAAQLEAYQKVGGTPHLDAQYTVYGEVTKGMDVVEKIEKSETGRNDRPVNDIRIIKMTIKH
ncbi:MAG: peptidylprolyl isomerase [Muribaculaceae bacterium]